jgi:putative phosphoribosyl transferase
MLVNSKNTDLLFVDRKDAAEQLGDLLEQDFKNSNTLILGKPRGGIEIAYHLANKLNCSWSLVVSKKISLPGYEEVGPGAVAEEGSVYLPGNILPSVIATGIVERQKNEINKRAAIYRGGKPLPSMKNREVILVDDGITSGISFVPVIRLCREKQAEKIIVATPVAAPDYNFHLNEADEVIILSQPDFFYSVGQAYVNFNHLSDSSLLRFINTPSFEKDALGLVENYGYERQIKNR